MQTVVAFALVRPFCFCFCLSQPIASASLSPNGTWEHLCCDGDTSGRNAHNAWSSRSALVPVSGNLGSFRFTSRQPMSSGPGLLGGAAEKGVGEVLGKRGGYGSGYAWKC